MMFDFIPFVCQECNRVLGPCWVHSLDGQLEKEEKKVKITALGCKRPRARSLQNRQWLKYLIGSWGGRALSLIRPVKVHPPRELISLSLSACVPLTLFSWQGTESMCSLVCVFPLTLPVTSPSLSVSFCPS